MHPSILKRLADTNFEQLDGYGADAYSVSAKKKILAECDCPEGDVFFLVGGTQTNSTVIAALLSDAEGVVSVDTGHIAVHEAGAVEYTGHKVLTIPGKDGKMEADALEAYLAAFEADSSHSHMVWPGLVYVSLSTELGTLYTREELLKLRKVASSHGLPLFIDGARLGYALASPACDITLADLKDLCDVFYIGGTKVGAMMGEAVVFPAGAPRRFFSTVKQHGALLAKGRFLGLQFDTLFTDGLYLKIASNAIERSRELVEVFKAKGIPFYMESPTNLQFVVLENSRMEELSRKVEFDFFATYDATHTVVRFATSWATTKEQVEELAFLL